ncbi:amino acid ABC transporter permease [Halorussus gelatinilyticus]|uniref:Amino acid ABC transporter permease n=1 Tax=Halorussus gelatinilyticus TaxID=2937524 RepID=A0A8U0IJJ0_9EURY|nr:amino acid ABC transporter permease [Halorussus gelatinilyticus]UPW00845.1 amino acid ABC transporter permease [Halorussus gelatinilyticus]
MAETYTEDRGGEVTTDEGLLTDERVKWAGLSVAVAFTATIIAFVGYILLEFVDYELLMVVWPRFVGATWLVIQIVLISSVLALTAGVFVGLGRVSKTALTNSIATAYVEFFRGTPLLFQLFIIYLGIPQLWPPAWGPFPATNWSFAAAIIGLTLNHAAYVGEAVKGGINAVPDGQMEAARSLGMSYVDSMREVILPQASRNALAAIGNDLVILVKDTSLLTVLAVPEIISVFRNINSNQFDAWTPIVLVSISYLVITLPLMRTIRYFEARAEWGSGDDEDEEPRDWLAWGEH